MTQLRLSMPSDGALAIPAEEFMRDCGLPIRRASQRRLTADIPDMKDVVVFFQRASDITTAVDQGGPDIGILGFDQFQESDQVSGDAVLLYELGFGRSKVVFAVPEERSDWKNVRSVPELLNKLKNNVDNEEPVRIATKYPRLVNRFLNASGRDVLRKSYQLIHIRGALEAVPSMGSADLIADIKDTGMTMSDNRLVSLDDDPVFSSQAVLIANAKTLGEDVGKQEQTRSILERMEAYNKALPHFKITANYYLEDGESGSKEPNCPESVAKKITNDRRFAGLLGPTIARVYPKAAMKDDERKLIKDPERWYSVQMVVKKSELVEVVNHLRSIGGSAIIVSDLLFIFDPIEGRDRLQRVLDRHSSGVYRE